ncbi:MAG: hypothetical protein K0R48_1302 [Gammaproteobacteria bacterium]|nr:hypothetical protein [Gammaproteobacteria bacterium]
MSASEGSFSLNAFEVNIEDVENNNNLSEYVDQPALPLSSWEKEEEEMYNRLIELLEELEAPVSPLNKRARLNKIAKIVSIVVGFAGSKVYASGSINAFPHRSYLAISTAICAFITSSFSTFWAAFDVIDNFTFGSPKKENFLNLKEKRPYYVRFILPAVCGGLASTPITGLTAKQTESNLRIRIFWTGAAFLVEFVLNTFSMQKLILGVSCTINLSKEDKEVLERAREVFLNRLQQERCHFTEWGYEKITAQGLLNLLHNSREEYIISGWAISFFQKLVQLVCIIGLPGYTVVIYEILNWVFKLEQESLDFVIKLPLTLAAIIPFSYIMLIGAKGVMEGICQIVISLFQCQFKELLQKNPAYQLLPTAFIAGTIGFMALALGSGVTSGDTARKNTPVFIEYPLSLVDIHLDVASDGVTANIIGLCAYMASVMFNGFGSVGFLWPFLEWLSGILIKENWLAPEVLVAKVEQLSSASESSEEQKNKLYRFLKHLNDFDSLLSTFERLPLNECAWLINLDNTIKENTLEKARIDSAEWDSILRKMRGRESAEQAPQNDRTRLLSHSQNQYGYFNATDVNMENTNSVNEQEQGDPENGFCPYAIGCTIL